MVGKGLKASGSKNKRTKRVREDVDEEKELEARLFGSRKEKMAASRAIDNNDEDEGETGLGWMQDDELFTVDIPGAEEGDPLIEADDVSEDELEPTFEYPAGAMANDSESDSDDDKEAYPSRESALWHDPADQQATVSLQSSKRLKKLGRKKNEDHVNGEELQRKLREQFERLHPKPQWASRRITSGVPSIQKLLMSTASFTASEERAPLPPSFLDIHRLRNANDQNPTTGKKQASDAGAGVLDVAWHPSRTVSVMAVAGGDRRVRFFNIDGHTNAALLTLHVPSLPITRSTFHPSGSSMLLAGTRPFYYTYDLAAQTCIRSPRNLFGSQPSPSSPQSLDRHRFSPDGSLLAVAGRRGCVSLLEWGTGGSTGVVIGELRSGRGGTVADLSWNEDGSQLSVLGGRNGSEVEVWDVGERHIVRKWSDDRAFGGQIMRSSAGYSAIGSSTGIVNMYSNDHLHTPRPEPLKSLEHLTTSINTMAFHPSGELFVAASSAKRDALKLYHLPSGSAFSNWPTSSTPLGRVNIAGFAPNGEYMAIGNTKGAVLLWSLKHFAN